MPENTTPKLPQMAEGELYLFVRLNPKTNEFSCLVSDHLGALALISLAAAHITSSITAQPVQAPASPIAPGMMKHFSRRGN